MIINLCGHFLNKHPGRDAVLLLAIVSDDEPIVNQDFRRILYINLKLINRDSLISADV